MELREASDRVLLGESLQQLAKAYREQLLIDLGLDPEEADPSTFAADTARFMQKLCRHLGERHDGDARVANALCEWAQRTDDYDAFDALLGGQFVFDARERLVARGRALFPGPLTAHWDGG